MTKPKTYYAEAANKAINRPTVFVMVASQNGTPIMQPKTPAPIQFRNGRLTTYDADVQQYLDELIAHHAHLGRATSLGVWTAKDLTPQSEGVPIESDVTVKGVPVESDVTLAPLAGVSQKKEALEALASQGVDVSNVNVLRATVAEVKALAAANGFHFPDWS